MPRMGYDMEKGTVVSWLKHEGDGVAQGEAIAEIEADKAVFEFEAPASGSLLRIFVVEGTAVPVGGVIAYIGEPGEAVPEATEAEPRLPPGPGLLVPSTSPAGDSVSRRFVSPLARRLASELGVDLSLVEGTGPLGRVTRDDVLAFHDGGVEDETRRVADPGAATVTPTEQGGLSPRQPDPDGRIPIGKMGQAVARRTRSTFNEAPHFYVTVRVDMTEAMAWRDALNSPLSADQRVSVNDLLMKACSIALERHPAFNATFEGDHLRVHPHVNMGMAVALQEGLIVPAIPSCEGKSVADIAAAAKDLAARARAGSLRQEEYTGTFSVSNLGMFGVSAFAAIIVSPQVAMLAVGEVEDTAVPRDGGVQIRKMMSATLSADHRAVSGAEAALFTAEIRRVLEHPAELE
ncbi:MAG: dihydrolipoamide acetyltransferase family protein [Chloroflexi bacterium]|nr:dihydrolipoamide acetyltransferase family protein [Chloroflexota bacterium]